MKKINVYDMQGKIVAEESLPEELISKPLNKDIIYYYVNAHMANRRQGTSSAKTRGEVSGSGKKPWRQKGTGRARVGSSRTPLWRHGGVVFGPSPRDYGQRLPKKVKKSALREVLKDKMHEDRFALFMPEKLESPRTKVFAGFLKKAGCENEKILFVFANDRASNGNLIKSLKNISSVTYDFSNQLSAYEVLKSDRVIAEKSVFGAIKEYLGEEQ
ncbi:MAG: 50S ribosomal protein L4 [Candidatus Omnitrophica bacterium]|nr:50S ribosomal protein L4 [Candidatus Omnitrophota bacterium]